MHRGHIALVHVGQNAVLFMADSDFIMAVQLRQAGDDAHLLCCGIARCGAVGLERDGDDCVCGIPVRIEVGIGERPENRVARERRLECPGRRLDERWFREHRADALEECLVHASECLALNQEALLDAFSEGLEPVLVDRDLDARLVLVIATPDGVVDLQDGLDVGQ